MEDSKINKRHFNTLRPQCPVCRLKGKQSALEIGCAIDETDTVLNEGILNCSNAECRSEFPVIDGIPIILPNIREYISQNILPIMARCDLSETMDSLLGDCCGQGSAFDFCRQHVSTYAFSHYEDLHTGTSCPAPESAGSVAQLLKEALKLLGTESISGPVLDIGCSVGRTTFELAEVFSGPVVGIDLNFSMLKVAAGVLRRGAVAYPRRKEGIAYERVSFPVSFFHTDQVDFWVCDATALPFENEAFSMAASLNVLDCVWSPYHHLQELARVLRPDSKAILSTPYDWTAGVTPVEAWLGGHSQRSVHKGEGASVLRAILSSEQDRGTIQGLEMVREGDAEWTLRLYDRSSMKYITHLVVLQKKG